MDFFQSQDQARKKTRLLVIYFALAVIAIIFAIYTVAVPLLYFKQSRPSESPQGNDVWPGDTTTEVTLAARREGFFHLDWFLTVAAVVSGVILVGSGFKSLQLGGGGSTVALDLGGRRVDPNTGDADERKLINVVEEMAIASGIPVPEVYVLEHEPGVNAFAAGKSFSDAAIGVTHGAIKLLTRDELQGVIAHEFSHVLNGDMKLNLRLIGVLHGILIIAILGRLILRGMFYSGSSRDNGKGGAAAAGIAILGIGVLVIGYIGVFFGHLIKSAISRQREFLADASAVQFTRNPDGIAGALKKIGGLSYGSRLESARAEEVSHMVFANGLGALQFSALATHPPLDARLRAIEPGWDGKFTKVKLAKISSSMPGGAQPAGAGGALGSVLQIPGLEGHGAIVGGITAAAAMESIGKIRPEQVERAQQIRSGLPPEWLEATRNVSGAQALIFSMLLAQDDALLAGELSMLRDTGDELTFKMVTDWHAEISKLDSPQKIALIDLSIPALKRLSHDEYQRFHEIMRELVESDGRIDLFEFMLERIVRRHLDLFFVTKPVPKVRHHTLAALEREATVLVSMLARLSSSEPEGVERAFREGASELEFEIGSGVEMASGEDCGLEQIAEALERFDEASPLVKRTLIYACSKTAMADGKIVSQEAEMLRAVADTIGCPIPPFVSEQSAGADRLLAEH